MSASTARATVRRADPYSAARASGPVYTTVIGREELPMRVPVNIDAWRWPLRTDGPVECGECREVLLVERFTALSELAEAVECHTARCQRA
ncbi:hypothetical protein O7626_01440 [Micromonospora sp. WMMD1102]|uniref:hypothetical protein n=1 Tax=Micromonospora sp. WMMD1102 TaxID=3016105 RepID=UPI002414F2E2|nr:hypothetical protein [Micromonospora sp. WMMD1102]MDG4784610.1 hypothetical protein [Micromonospora sp. WMMD1102]